MIVSLWLNGKRSRPSKESIELLADRFGLEVYDALGMEKPDPALYRITKKWKFLSQDVKDEISQLVDKAETGS